MCSLDYFEHILLTFSHKRYRLSLLSIIIIAIIIIIIVIINIIIIIIYVQRLQWSK